MSPNREASKTFVGASAILIVFVLAVLLYQYMNPSSYELEKLAKVKLVNNWLEDQRKGNDGYRFWSNEPFGSKQRLYSVATWEVVDSSSSDVRVLVNSSTKLGIPIRKTWGISFPYSGKPLAIQQVKDLSQ